jgi:Activator of Hsp90 ATPase homolog 1-like protein
MTTLTSPATVLADDYQCNIHAPIPAKEAFDKISRVAEWWAEDFTGSARKLGDTFTIRIGETFADFRITKAVPDTRIVWQVTDCHLHWLKDKTEWKGTSVLWELSSHEGTTAVTMTHLGLVPAVECYGNCEAGWNFYVATSLFQFMTEGEGQPDGRKKRPA